MFLSGGLLYMCVLYDKRRVILYYPLWVLNQCIFVVQVFGKIHLKYMCIFRS